MKMKYILSGLFLFAVLFRAAAASEPVEGGGLGSIDPAALDPAIYKPVPEKWNEKNRTWQGIPSIEVTAGGRVWIVWYSGGEWEGPDNYLLLITSGDGGSTWSKPFMALGRDDQIRLFDPALWRDPDGRLWLFWAQSESTFRENARSKRSGTDATASGRCTPKTPKRGRTPSGRSPAVSATGS